MAARARGPLLNLRFLLVLDEVDSAAVGIATCYPHPPIWPRPVFNELRKFPG